MPICRLRCHSTPCGGAIWSCYQLLPKEGTCQAHQCLLHKGSSAVSYLNHQGMTNALKTALGSSGGKGARTCEGSRVTRAKSNNTKRNNDMFNTLEPLSITAVSWVRGWLKWTSNVNQKSDIHPQGTQLLRNIRKNSGKNWKLRTFFLAWRQRLILMDELDGDGFKFVAIFFVLSSK